MWPVQHALQVKEKHLFSDSDIVLSEVWPSSETTGSFQTASLCLYKEPSCAECLFWWVVPRYVESLTLSQVETKQHFHMTEAPVSRGDDRTSCRHSTSEFHSNTGEQLCSVDLQFFWFWRIQTLNFTWKLWNIYFSLRQLSVPAEGVTVTITKSRWLKFNW